MKKGLWGRKGVKRGVVVGLYEVNVKVKVNELSVIFSYV